MQFWPGISMTGSAEHRLGSSMSLQLAETVLGASIAYHVSRITHHLFAHERLS